MDFKPILFNTDMVRAILDERKTQTRRLIRCNSFDVYKMSCFRGLWHDKYDPQNPPPFLVEVYARSWKRTPCNTGDVLWVRKTWAFDTGEEDYGTGCFMYKADMPIHIDAKDTAHCEDVDITADDFKWHPSIHMPKEAARIFLRAKAIRVERLNDMSEEDAIAEGFPDSPAGTDSPLERFSTLWDKTIKHSEQDLYSWYANPWVWVITT